jgi:hypothetical protein
MSVSHNPLIISFLVGLVFTLIVILVNRETFYFTFQEIETILEISGTQQVTKEYTTKSSIKRLEFLRVKVKEIGTDPNKVVCHVTHIGEKYVNDLHMVLPKSQIYKRNKFFWKQTFKPIK